jgi:hypothetical protein
LLDGGGIREAGLAQPPLGGGVGACGTLFFEQALQEIGVTQFLGGSAVQPLRQDAGCLVHAEVVQQRLQAAS